MTFFGVLLRDWCGAHQRLHVDDGTAVTRRLYEATIGAFRRLVAKFEFRGPHDNKDAAQLQRPETMGVAIGSGRGEAEHVLAQFGSLTIYPRLIQRACRLRGWSVCDWWGRG